MKLRIKWAEFNISETTITYLSYKQLWCPLTVSLEIHDDFKLQQMTATSASSREILCITRRNANALVFKLFLHAYRWRQLESKLENSNKHELNGNVTHSMDVENHIVELQCDRCHWANCVIGRPEPKLLQSCTPNANCIGVYKFISLALSFPLAPIKLTTHQLNVNFQADVRYLENEEQSLLVLIALQCRSANWKFRYVGQYNLKNYQLNCFTPTQSLISKSKYFPETFGVS